MSDQGYTYLASGCPGCRVYKGDKAIRPAFIITERHGHRYWTCPMCEGSYGEVEPQPQAVTEDARDGERKPTDEDQALDLLALLFEAYEEGPSCYEDPEEGTGFLGHAVRMDHEDFHRCADLLNRRRPVDAARAASSGSEGEERG